MDIFYPLKWFADLVTHGWFGLDLSRGLGSALDFFIYDVAKIMIMLVVIVFAVAIIRSYFPPEKTRKYLSHSRLYVGNVLAAMLGIVTPFCSCSAVPMFIGFVESGVPLGVTFSFLIASPTINEVAAVLLFGLFGWKIAAIYIAAGLFVAIAAGILIGALGMEDQIEDYVREIRMGEGAVIDQKWADRVAYAKQYVKDIVGRIWLYVLIGIAIGAAIHGYAPADFLVRYAGPSNPLAVPLVVLIGIPLYSNAAGIVPVVQVLMEKGLPIGTALAFMMSVVAISPPELIILRKVIKPKLIAVFVGVVAVAILGIGYLFNWLVPLVR
jgi:uncharacterized protein